MGQTDSCKREIALPRQNLAAFASLVLPFLAIAPAEAATRHHHAAVGPVAIGPVEIGIVAFNDFHGNLEPPRQSVAVPDGKGGTVAVPAGGAAWFASAVEQIRAKYRYHLTVAAGDMTSASQLASSLYLDEPTVGVMNRLGVDYNAVGNHEFDRGRAELLRLQNGGCAKYTVHQPCALEPFAGASYHYLAASTVDVATGKTLFPASDLRWFGKGRGRVSVG
jgi:5'-nucleotidase